MRTVFLHGFTQTGRSWLPITSRLSISDIHTPDLPGHGSAETSETSLEAAARDLIIEHPNSAVVGYSMGGRFALHAATRFSGQLRGLVLISASPGLEDANERSERRESDDRLASHVEEIGIDQFLDEWLAQPLFASLPHDSSALDDRRRNTPQGLAWSLRHWGTGSQDSLWGSLPRIDCPVLLITGSRDSKFTQIATRMASLIEDCRHQVIDGAGHAVHLEQPELVAALIDDFLLGVANNPSGE